MTVNGFSRGSQLLQPSIFFIGIRSSAKWHPILTRSLGNDTSLASSKRLPIFPNHSESRVAEQPALARLPTSSLVRGLLLGTFLSSPLLFTPGFALLKKIANSPSRILNPDRNPILRAIVKPLMYDQFCAGRNRLEIQARVLQIKSLGFSGVILCYGKENQIQRSGQHLMDDVQHSDSVLDEELQVWRQGNLETLDMIGDGDFLGIKYGRAAIHLQ